MAPPIFWTSSSSLATILSILVSLSTGVSTSVVLSPSFTSLYPFISHVTVLSSSSKLFPVIFTVYSPVKPPITVLSPVIVISSAFNSFLSTVITLSAYTFPSNFDVASITNSSIVSSGAIVNLAPPTFSTSSPSTAIIS